MWIFFLFVRRLDFRFGPFLFFPVFDSTCDMIPDSASKNVKARYRRCSIASRLTSLRIVLVTLVCYIRGVKVYGHMSHSSVLLGRQIHVGAHPIDYLISVSG